MAAIHLRPIEPIQNPIDLFTHAISLTEKQLWIELHLVNRRLFEPAVPSSLQLYVLPPRRRLVSKAPSKRLRLRMFDVRYRWMRSRMASGGSTSISDPNSN